MLDNQSKSLFFRYTPYRIHLLGRGVFCNTNFHPIISCYLDFQKKFLPWPPLTPPTRAKKSYSLHFNVYSFLFSRFQGEGTACSHLRSPCNRTDRYQLPSQCPEDLPLLPVFHLDPRAAWILHAYND